MRQNLPSFPRTDFAARADILLQQHRRVRLAAARFTLKKTRILLADDYAVVRCGIRVLIEREGGWEVCGEAETGREAVKLAGELQPDVVVLDIGMPELNGIDAARQIKRERPETEILIFSLHESAQIVREVFEAGARGYLLKSDASFHLIPAIESLILGRPYFSRRISEIVFSNYIAGTIGAGSASAASRISGREREIVQLLCEGATNKVAGAKLGLSVQTIETHRKNIMSKLNLKAFSELVIYAVRHRIIEA
jgi:DNA-binding NarL/FixJ family response regulator